MSFFGKIFGGAVADGAKRISGRTDILEAAAAICAGVSAADGKIEDDEVAAAIEAVNSVEAITSAFTSTQIESALNKQFARAKNAVGRMQLKKEITDIAKSDEETRQLVFVCGVMAAQAVGGVGPEEQAKLREYGKLLELGSSVEELMAA